MKWDTFQRAWQAASASAQSTARHAAANPESAAAVLSDDIVHCLKLALYAAQDIEKESAAPVQASSKPLTPPELSVVTRALHDVQSGRVPPAMAEAHIQRATQEASQNMVAKLEQSLKTQSGSAGGKTHAQHKTLAAERQRFRTMRTQIMQHLSVINGILEKSIEASINSTQAQHGASFANARQALHVSLAFEKINRFFLEGKAVDSPIATAPE